MPLAERFAQGLRAGAPDLERSGLLASYVRTMETGEPTERRPLSCKTPWFR